MTDSKSSFINRLLGEPILHFFVIGAIIYGAFYIVAKEEPLPQEQTIVLSEQQIEWLAASFEGSWKRRPTQAELDGLIEYTVRETALYREALKMGLDRDDTVIRQRLAQKIRFLSQDLQRIPEPTDAQLQAYLDDHQDRYALEAEIAFAHVFFNPDKRKDQLIPDAEGTLKILLEQSVAPGSSAEFGDGMLLPGAFSGARKAEVARNFGIEFADQVFALQPGGWQGPVSSAYGLHLVYVSDLQQPALPGIEDLRDRLSRDWAQSQSEELSEAFVDRIVSQYRIILAPTDGIPVQPDSRSGS